MSRGIAMATITWNTEVNAPCCPGEIVADDGRTVLVQTDWDFPATASSFGWSLREVQRCRKCKECKECKTVLGAGTPLFACSACDDLVQRCCEHRGTDGTVDCKECGCTASAFIEAAGEWLRENDGATADDPGYFAE